jgi:hypothetical protein
MRSFNVCFIDVTELEVIRQIAIMFSAIWNTGPADMY